MQPGPPRQFREPLCGERAQHWEPLRSGDVARDAVGPDGQAGELVDSVVLLRRR